MRKQRCQLGWLAFLMIFLVASTSLYLFILNSCFSVGRSRRPLHFGGKNEKIPRTPSWLDVSGERRSKFVKVRDLVAPSISHFKSLEDKQLLGPFSWSPRGNEEVSLRTKATTHHWIKDRLQEFNVIQWMLKDALKWLDWAHLYQKIYLKVSRTEIEGGNWRSLFNAINWFQLIN